MPGRIVDETTISLSAWQSTYSQDAHSFSQTAAQIFVSPISDYHLLGTALAVDGGVALPEIIDDLDGNARPQGAGYDIGAYEWMSAPKATIQANGSNGPLTVSLGSTVSLTLSLDPDQFYGQPSDWWVVQAAPTELYYLEWSKQTMAKGVLPTYQGGLFGFTDFPIATFTNLVQGTHDFYFGVDLNMNGSLDMSSTYYDWVSVNVTGP